MRTVKLSDIIIGLPILHLTCASLFLVGYCWYFGSKTASFVSPADILAVSIGDVGPIYLFMILPLIGYLLWMRAAMGAWTSAEAVNLKPEGPVREVALKRHESNKRFFKWLFLIVVIGQVISAGISYYQHGYIPMALVQNLLIVVFAVLNIWMANKLDISSPAFHLTYVLGIIFLYSWFGGMSRAQNDLRQDYNFSVLRGPSCSDFAVLRKFSDHYLVVRRDGEKALINEDCRQVFLLRGRTSAEAK